MSVINRCDPVPHLSLDAALRMVLAAENLAEAGLSWQQTLSLVTWHSTRICNVCKIIYICYCLHVCIYIYMYADRLYYAATCFLQVQAGPVPLIHQTIDLFIM